MEKKILSASLDWRHRFVNKLFQVADGIEGQVFSGREMEATVQDLDYSQALELPSTRRLYGLNQVSPVAERMLGFEVTRGQHTEDTMRLTTFLLTYLQHNSPEVFLDLIKPYKLEPEVVIRHGVEYMRLHDALTLAFQGAMHGKVKLNGEGYDENQALLASFKGEQAYKPFSDLLFDEATLGYYQASGLDINIIHQFAEDAINGSTLLGRMLKKGEDCLSIDWLSYTARDFDELTGIFAVNDDLPFGEKIRQVMESLQGVSSALVQGAPYNLPNKVSETRSIEQLVSSHIVRLDKIDGYPRLIYDGYSTFQIYIMHLALRLLFSGSPWIRRTNSYFYNLLTDQFVGDQDRLIKELLSRSEEDLLARCKMDEPSIVNLSPQSLLHPEVLPEQIKGWHYTTAPTEPGPVSFVFKKVGQTPVDLEGEIIPFEQAFPELTILIEEIKNQPQLYLKQSV